MDLKDAATGHEAETKKIIINKEVKKRNTAMDFLQPGLFLGKAHLQSRYENNGSSLEVIHDTARKDLNVKNLNKQSDSGQVSDPGFYSN